MDQLVTESSQMALFLSCYLKRVKLASQGLNNDHIGDQKGRLPRNQKAILAKDEVEAAGSSSDLRGADGGIFTTVLINLTA